jgi:branched-chain amino acid transport system ATP-binding protein
MDDVHSYYGNSHVLHGVSLKVDKGQVVALLGRNGMGKTTTIRAIMGMTPARSGKIAFGGTDITRWPPHRIAHAGIGLVPQGRRVFRSLTVEENLRIVARQRTNTDAWNLERLYQLFPILSERRSQMAGLLSGGEQQMLAIGRALMTSPSAVLLDEPSEGLAPSVVQRVGETIVHLRDAGIMVLLVEQVVQMALTVSDYVYVLSKGRVVHEASPEALRTDDATMRLHLGVGTSERRSPPAREKDA